MAVSKWAFMHARYESSVRDYYEVKEEGWISSLLKYCFINAYGLAWVLGWSWGYEKCEFAIVGSLMKRLSSKDEVNKKQKFVAYLG